MPKKRAHSFEELESQQYKMDMTDEEVLEQKPDRDAIEKWASDVLVKLGEIHEDVRELRRDLAYVISQLEALESRKEVEEHLASAPEQKERPNSDCSRIETLRWVGTLGSPR
jgi:hypothetical protein